MNYVLRLYFFQNHIFFPNFLFSGEKKSRWKKSEKMKFIFSPKNISFSQLFKKSGISLGLIIKIFGLLLQE